MTGWGTHSWRGRGEALGTSRRPIQHQPRPGPFVVLEGVGGKAREAHLRRWWGRCDLGQPGAQAAACRRCLGHCSGALGSRGGPASPGFINWQINWSHKGLGPGRVRAQLPWGWVVGVRDGRPPPQAVPPSP